MAKILLKSKQDIEGIRRASQITASILDRVQQLIAPGVSTEEIDAFVASCMRDAGATAATLGYKGYPKSCCTSVNDVICHGIPSEAEILKAGDIINVDVTSIKDGYYGDSSRMYLVGGEQAVSEEARRLCAVTKDALLAGIETVRVGRRVNEIGASIEKFIRNLPEQYGIVREYTGHGIGRSFHEPPQILHFDAGFSGPRMKAGMVFTIEPMVNLGAPDTVLSKEDGWTVRTRDGSLSAQWEHTVLVTDNGAELLTYSEHF